jgi:hypothetical protein
MSRLLALSLLSLQATQPIATSTMRGRSHQHVDLQAVDRAAHERDHQDAAAIVAACATARSCKACTEATVTGKFCPNNMCSWCQQTNTCSPLDIDTVPGNCQSNNRVGKVAWLNYDSLKTPYVPACDHPTFHSADHYRRHSIGIELEISGWSLGPAGPNIANLQKHEVQWSTANGMLSIEAEPQSAGWGIEFVTKPVQLSTDGRKELGTTMDQTMAWCANVKTWADQNVGTPVPNTHTLFPNTRTLVPVVNVHARNYEFRGAAQVTAAVRLDRLWALFGSAHMATLMDGSAHLQACVTKVNTHPRNALFTPEYKSFLAYMCYMVSEWYSTVGNNNDNCLYFNGDRANAKDGVVFVLVRTRMGDWLAHALSTMPAAVPNSPNHNTNVARDWLAMLTPGAANNILTHQRPNTCNDVLMVHPNPNAIDPQTGARPQITVEAWLAGLANGDMQWKMHGSFGTTGLQKRGDTVAVVIEFRSPETRVPKGPKVHQGISKGFAKRLLDVDERQLNPCARWKELAYAYFDYFNDLNEQGLPNKAPIAHAKIS